MGAHIFQFYVWWKRTIFMNLRLQTFSVIVVIPHCLVNFIRFSGREKTETDIKTSGPRRTSTFLPQRYQITDFYFEERIFGKGKRYKWRENKEQKTKEKKFWWSFSCNSQSFQLPLVIGSYNCYLNLGKFVFFVERCGSILSDESERKRVGRGRKMKKDKRRGKR